MHDFIIGVSLGSVLGMFIIEWLNNDFDKRAKAIDERIAALEKIAAGLKGKP